ncbi:hypothetical protein ACVWZ8_001810 [Arthrobacter sp. UYCu723]
MLRPLLLIRVQYPPLCQQDVRLETPDGGTAWFHAIRTGGAAVGHYGMLCRGGYSSPAPRTGRLATNG